MGQKMPVVRIDLSNCPSDAAWYTVVTLYNYEKKYAEGLLSGLTNSGLEGKITEVVVPFKETEYETTTKTGKKTKKTKVEKIMPLYVFVKAYMCEQVWDYMRNTPGASTILAANGAPSIMDNSEVIKIKNICGITEKEKAAAVENFAGKIGDKTIIISGPFAAYQGTILDIYTTKSKARVMLNNGIPVEVDIKELKLY